MKLANEVKEARKILDKDPTNPDANLTVGRYLCVTKGDGDQGIAMLALGAEKPLKAVATQDLRLGTSKQAAMTLGDAWWVLADAYSGGVKDHWRAQAAFWYQQALPTLTGLNAEKIQKRVEDVAAEEKKEQSRRGRQDEVDQCPLPSAPCRRILPRTEARRTTCDQF